MQEPEPEFEVEEVIYTNNPLTVDVGKFTNKEQLVNHMTVMLNYIDLLKDAISNMATSVTFVSYEDLGSILTTLEKYRNMLLSIQSSCQDKEIKGLLDKALFDIYYNIGRLRYLIASKKTKDILHSSKNFKNDDYFIFQRQCASLQDCLKNEVLPCLDRAKLEQDKAIRDYYRQSLYMICDTLLNLGVVRGILGRRLFLDSSETDGVMNNLVVLANVLIYDSVFDQAVMGLLERIKLLNQDLLSAIVNKIRPEVIERLRKEYQYDLVEFIPQSKKEKEDLTELARMIEGDDRTKSQPKKQNPFKQAAKPVLKGNSKVKKEEAEETNGKNRKPRRKIRQNKGKKNVPPYLRGVKILETEQSTAKSRNSEGEFSGEEPFFAYSENFLMMLRDAVKKFEKEHLRHRGQFTMAKQQETGESTSSDPRFFSKFNAKETKEFLQKRWDGEWKRAEEGRYSDVVVWAPENTS